MRSNLRKAVIIGETKLCTQCTEYLMNNGWQIVAMVSDDDVVVEWSRNKSITVLPTDQLGKINENRFYLFSIINPYLIPKSFLESKDIPLALNYHDSLLPRYAGINSTTWAIINNEQKHGVTLHQIVSGIDEGDIVAQSPVRIESDETATSLNLKCSERLLSLFKEVIEKIQAGTLSTSKQSLENKTYYGAKAIPDNYGVINGVKNLQILYSLVRGLSFDSRYENPVASVKVFLNGKFYIAEDFNANLIRDNLVPADSATLFNTVKDIYGRKTDLKVMYKDISDLHALTNDELAYLSKVKAKEKKQKKQILEFFGCSEASREVLDYVASGGNSDEYVNEIAVPKCIDTVTALASVYFVLARFFHNNDFIASLYLSDDLVASSALRYLMERRNFIRINNDMLNGGFVYLKNHFKQLQENCYVLAKDFGYRYNLQLLTDIAIAIGGDECTDWHKMMIKIDDGKVVIKGSAAYQLQIDSMTMLFRNVFSKNIQKKMMAGDLKRIDILDSVQRQQIVYELNKTEQDYPQEKTIHELFEEQVLKAPNKTAVVFEDRKLTYGELNDRANQLANYLKDSYKIKHDDLIAICLDRSEQMLVAMFGVLKAGGAYVPLDPNYPNDRIKYVLDNAKTKVILTNNVHKRKLQKLIDRDVLVLGSKKTQSILAKQKSVNLVTAVKNTNLAYVIYTSGTTGDPKGVMIEHKGVINYVTHLIRANKLNNQTVGSQYANFGFDAAVIETYPVLLAGGAINIIKDEDKLDLIKVNDIFTRKAITYAFLPTKFAEMFLELKNTSLKTLIVGGDKLQKFMPQSYQVINAYGPTEATVQSNFFIVEKQYQNIPIGKPIANVTNYVLDKHLNILPVGAVGELYIGGAGLARGYFNKPQLTAEKFISNSLKSSQEKARYTNTKLYKTGDLVRMISDGNLEFIGRNDNQVKIRGFRIELGEIENRLLSHSQIEQVVVVTKEKDDGKYLVVYYVADRKLGQIKLRDYLSSRLPIYMVPEFFIHMQQFPFTKNGKLDKKRLPEPNLVNYLEYVAPKSKLEKEICKIYAQVLNLSVKQVGLTSDFFRMGGDSISSIQIVSQIRQLLGLTINVKDIFNYKNVGQLVANVLLGLSERQKDGKIKEGMVLEPLEKAQDSIEKENIYLANNLQQGFIYHAIRHGREDDTYVSRFVWQYKMPIDKNKFKKAWQLIQRKYPSLRLRFAWGDELTQIIEENKELYFRYIDFMHLKKEKGFDCQAQIASVIDQDRQKCYDLQKGGLIRIYLLKFSADDYRCACIAHHIILDGWSISLMVSKLHEIYTKLSEDKRMCLSVSEDMAYKMAQKYLQEHQNENKDYWDNYLKRAEERTNLKPLLKESARGVEIKSYLSIEQEEEQYMEIRGQSLAKLKDFCQAKAVTVNVVIQYVWHKILHLYGASNATVVGTVVSGRNIPIDGIEESVGLFVNTLPLICVHNKLDPIDQIKDIQNSINEINSKSNVNLADIQRSGERLFDSLIAYENFPAQKNSTDIKCGDIAGVFKVDYPLAMIVYEKKSGLVIQLKYAGELFARETISQLLDRLYFLIDQVSTGANKKTLTYLHQEEQQHIVVDHNKTDKYFSTDKIVHQLFEEQVLKTPENIAIVYDDRKLTYRELNDRANQLANYILKHNCISADDIIAIMLDRSGHTIISILGVLKAGAAYVPIDPEYPDERKKYILEDTKAKLIIKEKNSAYRTQDDKTLIIDSDIFQQVLSKESRSNPKINISAMDMAYVLYTSGTSGKPKGVMLEHLGCINRILEMMRIGQMTEHSRVLFKTNYVFDVSFSDIFTTLLAGASLFVTKEVFDIEEIFVKIKKYAIDICHFTPSQFELVKKIKGIEVFNRLKVLNFSGEALNLKLLDGLDENVKCINYYGPTETGEITFDSCARSKNLPALIGYPMSNIKIFVLDGNLKALPVGAVGELYVSGICLARGYLNRPDLTKKVFISNPFQTAGEKIKNINNVLYKTGDFVRILSDMNIEYIGRQDFQVKIGGNRIELEEIESGLISYQEIKQAVVVASEETDNKYLIAYYVADKKIDDQEIKNWLLKRLPRHMIPSVFVHMQELPITKNGKLDKKSLPKPSLVGKDAYIPPKNKQEKLVCVAFANVLNLRRVGVDFDFFSFGGNSIQAIRLVSMLQINFDIKIVDIFKLKTPRKIAEGTVFGKNFLQSKLEKVKLAYWNKQKGKASKDCVKIKSQKKLDDYTKATEGFSINASLKKPICNVLLTGSTGYLGCNILKQLLDLADYKIYLLVRADSYSEAVERIKKKYMFYFEKSLDQVINLRVFVIKADIEKECLGLSQIEHKSLATKIDSVIHAAALVKQYGEYEKFYSANVGATINLLEFAKITKLKDFHYISTVGVLFRTDKQCRYTEDDLPDTADVSERVYVHTKLQGEYQAIKYRAYGVNCNIYRVGNLAYISENYRAQENIEDNAFYTWLRCLFAIKCSAVDINAVEMSQTDLTAKAIVKIFENESLSNHTYHVFNPYLFDMTNVFRNLGFEVYSIGIFIDHIARYIKDDNYYDSIMKFLLRQGWMDWWEKENVVSVEILQDRTQRILKKIGFEWPQMTEEIFYNYLDSLQLSCNFSTSKDENGFIESGAPGGITRVYPVPSPLG